MTDTRLEEMLASAPVLPMDDDTRLIIMSDFHMGDGGKNDDFVRNGKLVEEALADYYLPGGYTLILNGDIEERLRARRELIRKAWPGMYAVFGRFRQEGRLRWLQGNHEILPGEAAVTDGPACSDTLARDSREPDLSRPFDGEALRLVQGNRSFLVYHGHQAALANSGRYNNLIGLALRVFANGLGIGNRSVAHDSGRRFRVEKHVYEFSRFQGIASIIGHTHRPLFESLSKTESLGYQIEQLCREFSTARPEEQRRIQDELHRLKSELIARNSRGLRRSGEHRLADSVYGDILVPCLFNSGCCVGKRGITGIEIKKGSISLVFWSSPERNTGRKSLRIDENHLRHAKTRMASGAYRTILRRESLDYIFSRIQLLG